MSRMRHEVIFIRSLTSLNFVFKDSSLTNYFTHNLKENNWIHTFPMGISAMQTASSKIWTPFIMSISYDDNHYTTGICTFYNHFIHLSSCVSIIIVISSNVGGFDSFYDGELCIFVNIVTVWKCCPISLL